MGKNNPCVTRSFYKVIPLVSALSLLVVTGSMNGTFTHAQALEIKYKKFIPTNADVQVIRTYDPRTKRESKETGMKFTRLIGKSGKDIAFIYKKGGQLQLRLVQNPDRKATILDQPLPGSFLWMQDYQTNGLQVANLNGHNGDEIVTITSDGASLGAYINIFALRNGRIKSILDKPKGYEVGGYKFIVEPARNGASRIAVYTDKEGTKSEILRVERQEI
jgi:hypothetical protein